MCKNHGENEIIIPSFCSGLGIVVYDIWFIWSLLGEPVFSKADVGMLDGEVWPGNKGWFWKAVLLCIMWCLWRERNA